MLTIRRVLICIILFGLTAWSQVPLVLSKRTVVGSATPYAPTPVVNPVKCDGNGNIYFRAWAPDRPEIHSTVYFLSRDGKESHALLPSAKDISDLRIADYAVSATGDVFVLFTGQEVARIITFDPKGKQAALVDVGIESHTSPNRLAIVGSGKFLIAGAHHLGGGKAEPFLGMFNSDGRFLGEVRFDDQVLSPKSIASLRSLYAVSTFADALRINIAPLDATEGRAYFIGAGLPDNLLIVGPGGIVQDSIKLRLPEGFTPSDIRVTGASALVEYQKDDRFLYQVIDTSDGSTINTYTADDMPGSLACYERDGSLTFLATGKDRKLIIRASP